MKDYHINKTKLPEVIDNSSATKQYDYMFISFYKKKIFKKNYILKPVF